MPTPMTPEDLLVELSHESEKRGWGPLDHETMQSIAPHLQDPQTFQAIQSGHLTVKHLLDEVQTAFQSGGATPRGSDPQDMFGSDATARRIRARHRARLAMGGQGLTVQEIDQLLQEEAPTALPGIAPTAQQAAERERKTVSALHTAMQSMGGTAGAEGAGSAVRGVR